MEILFTFIVNKISLIASARIKECAGRSFMNDVLHKTILQIALLFLSNRSQAFPKKVYFSTFLKLFLSL